MRARKKQFLMNNFWLSEASPSSVNQGVERSFVGGAWQPFDGNAAFQIVAIPEPPTGMITVFAGFILFLKSRKSGGCVVPNEATAPDAASP
jgi:hypothetical protein